MAQRKSSKTLSPVEYLARINPDASTAFQSLRQAVLVTFAATATFSSVIAALHWVDDLVESG